MIKAHSEQEIKIQIQIDQQKQMAKICHGVVSNVM